MLIRTNEKHLSCHCLVQRNSCYFKSLGIMALLRMGAKLSRTVNGKD